MSTMTAYMCVINAVCMTISPTKSPHKGTAWEEREDKRETNEGNSSPRGQLEVESAAKQYGAKKRERREHSLAVAATRSQRGAQEAHPKTKAAQAKRNARRQAGENDSLVRCEKCQQNRAVQNRAV